MHWRKLLLTIALSLPLFSAGASAVSAQGQVLGVHILHPEEITDAAELLKNDLNSEQWNFVTLPLPMTDLDKLDKWQTAFDEAKKLKIAPIVRLVSEFDPETGAWKIPTRADIIKIFNFLDQLEWPTAKKFVIVYNEVNHAGEWNNDINPESYAKVLRFTAEWAHTENNDYRILPAALDLAAPNGPTTMEAFTYLEQMLAYDPEIFSVVDYWNSHSYPNPAFSAPPTANGQNSLRGFEEELAWLKEKTAQEKRVFITETGWEENGKTKYKLKDYYNYAATNIWTDERVVAVTPFVLRGDPGPFAKFTLLDKDNNQSLQYEAVQEAVLAMSARNTIDVVGF